MSVRGLECLRVYLDNLGKKQKIATIRQQDLSRKATMEQRSNGFSPSRLLRMGGAEGRGEVLVARFTQK